MMNLIFSVDLVAILFLRVYWSVETSTLRWLRYSVISNAVQWHTRRLIMRAWVLCAAWWLNKCHKGTAVALETSVMDRSIVRLLHKQFESQSHHGIENEAAKIRRPNGYSRGWAESIDESEKQRPWVNPRPLSHGFLRERTWTHHVGFSLEEGMCFLRFGRMEHHCVHQILPFQNGEGFPNIDTFNRFCYSSYTIITVWDQAY